MPSARDFFGYDLPGVSDDDAAARLAAAVQAFQHDRGLPVTGLLDADTRAALVAAHGS
jgi:peptidoglycan hydrolase-like protein with peptidoglycan-binding domain